MRALERAQVAPGGVFLTLRVVPDRCLALPLSFGEICAFT